MMEGSIDCILVLGLRPFVPSRSFRVIRFESFVSNLLSRSIVLEVSSRCSSKASASNNHF